MSTVAPRIVICGGPRCGKTTLAERVGAELGIKPRHTDDLMMGMGWSEASAHIAEHWLTAAGPWVIEGVAAVRALRKWLKANPDGSPADIVQWMRVPKVAQSDGQRSMSRACETIWREVEPALRARGTPIQLEDLAEIHHHRGVRT